MAAINGKFDAFVSESVSVRAALHEVRQAVRYRLKPSHGHPRNANALKALLARFLRANSVCSEALLDIRDRIEVSFRRYVRLSVVRLGCAWMHVQCLC